MKKHTTFIVLGMALMLCSVGFSQGFYMSTGSGGVIFGSGDLSIADQGGVTFDNAPIGAELLLEISDGYEFRGGTGALTFMDVEEGGDPIDLDETVVAYASADGIDYSLLGAVVGGTTERELTFTGDGFKFLKLVNTSSNRDGFDFDTIIANHVTSVPEPSTTVLALACMAMLGLIRRNGC